MNRTNEAWVYELGQHPPGDEQALRDLRMSLLRGLTKSFAGRNVGEDVLEDAVQETLVRVLNNLARFEGRSRFLNWSMSIAVRVTMTELRKRHWKDVSLDDVLADADFVPDRAIDREAGPQKQSEQKTILETMHHVIANDLTDKQRRALLADLKGMAQEEIARRTGSNRNAMYKLTHNARKRLKRGRENAGYTAADIWATFG